MIDEPQAVRAHVMSGRMTVDGGYTLTVSFSSKEDARLAKSMFDTGDAVALAKLGGALPVPVPAPAPKPKTLESQSVALAAMLCRNEGFWAFVEAKYKQAVNTEKLAAEWLRKQLGLESRSQLHTDAHAQRHLNSIREAFLLWQSDNRIP